MVEALTRDIRRSAPPASGLRASAGARRSGV